MKNTASTLAGPIKRRSFVLAAMGALAGAWAGPGILRRLLRPGSETPPGKNQTGITVSINPMAVPRQTKGVNRHG